jgi:hypothetical protein
MVVGRFVRRLLDKSGQEFLENRHRRMSGWQCGTTWACGGTQGVAVRSASYCHAKLKACAHRKHALAQAVRAAVPSRRLPTTSPVSPKLQEILGVHVRSVKPKSALLHNKFLPKKCHDSPPTTAHTGLRVKPTHTVAHQYPQQRPHSHLKRCVPQHLLQLPRRRAHRVVGRQLQNNHV